MRMLHEQLRRCHSWCWFMIWEHVLPAGAVSTETPNPCYVTRRHSSTFFISSHWDENNLYAMSSSSHSKTHPNPLFIINALARHPLRGCCRHDNRVADSGTLAVSLARARCSHEDSPNGVVGDRNACTDATTANAQAIGATICIARY